MKTLIAALALVASSAFASRANAQIVVPSSPYGGQAGVVEVGQLGRYIRPYSYYAAASPYLPREYMGYGSNDFPFHGQAYGHPYDPWTWPYITQYPDGVILRYQMPLAR